MRRSILALCAVAALGCAPVWAEDARAAIEAANQRFEAAFNRGDAAGVAQMYTSDAALLPPSEARVDGRPAIESYWKSAIDAGLEDLVLETQEVTETADGAIEFGRFTVVGPDAASMAGNYAVLWLRGDDGWHFHRDMWTDDPPK